MFKDRNDAAAQLANQLLAYKGKNPLVLAIPRGAVPMALHIADALKGEMDVVLVRKLLFQTIAEHFETWFELASAGQFDDQGDHHTPKPYVRRGGLYSPVLPQPERACSLGACQLLCVSHDTAVAPGLFGAVERNVGSVQCVF